MTGAALLGAPGRLAAQDDLSPGQGMRIPRRESGVTFGPGGLVLISPDSAWLAQVRFRVQAFAAAGDGLEDEPSDRVLNEWTLRRARLWMGGHLADPRLTFLFQLAFSPQDLDQATWGRPVIVRDAFLTWRFDPRFRAGFGVAKLPGNRNRVLSSADALFFERGIVNNTFNLDRDFGVQAFWYDTVGTVPVHLSMAVTSGRGRAAGVGRGAGLLGRVEVLPLGPFTRGNDYVEGAQVREERPRLSVGAVLAHAWATERAGAQIGPLLGATTDITTGYLDALLKWDVWSVYAEYAWRGSPAAQPVAGGPVVHVGRGAMLQVSRLVAPTFEVSVRGSTTDPAARAAARGVPARREATASVAHFIAGHRLKLLGEASRTWSRVDGPGPVGPWVVDWVARAGMEMGL